MCRTGRAGRTGVPSKATLYYNNSDIAKNKKHVQDSMKEYCKSQTTCLRKLMLEYLGFPRAVLEELIFSELDEFEALTSLPGEMLFSFSHEKNVLEKIMEGIDYIETESDLLDDYNIWNENCSAKIFSFISKYAPLIEDDTCDTYND